MRIPIKSFGGIQPKVQAHLLANESATKAVDVVLERGNLTPLKKPTQTTTLAKNGTIKTIYRFGKSLDDDTKFWFHWNEDVDITRGPIPDDTSERTYFTVEGGQYPMVTDASMATTNNSMPSNAYRLGIPAPSSRALVTVTPQNNPGNLEAQSCLLAYAFVTGWGEEGPLSEVSAPFDAMTGDTVNVVSMQGVPSGAYNITHRRLYVSVVDAMGSATLRFWKELPSSSTTYSGQLDFTELAEAAPEFSPIAPPDDLFGLIAHPGSFLIGFSGQKVYRSEPLKPYAWPHFTPLADDIVGGAVVGQAVVICTKGSTYLATQADPITFTPARLEGNQPCVAKRTIKAFKGGVVYASPDGLVLVDPGSGLSLATETIFTRDQWQTYKPESMHAAVHDNRYYCWYDNGQSKGCLILELSASGVTLTESTQYATAAYTDWRRDEMFVVIENNKVHKWNSGQNIKYQWASKTFLAERPQNIGAVQVIAQSYPIDFELKAVIETDSGARTITTTKTITNGRPARLSGSYRAREYSFTVKAESVIREVTIASTLANVTAQ